MTRKLAVTFLWHMHQPLYKDLLTGKYHLPWVRLHSTYSYLDMVSVLEEFPAARVTFNYTPSLIWQLLDISSGGRPDDLFYELTAIDPRDMDGAQKRFVLKNFFSCDLKNAIFPIERYKEFFLRRGNDLREEELEKKSREFNDNDMRDLQVFFNLAWCGFTLREKNPLVKGLIAKGGGYTEGEKEQLLKLQLEVVASILPKHKKLQDEGQIEISTTPFYHPIMPLLCGPLQGKGYGLKEDAREQLRRGIDLYEKVFAKRPVGMWPSEGSVSQDIIPLLAKEGIEWMATDEGIAIESFRGRDITREDLIYGAFTAEESGHKIDMIFRDINISNAISFRYSGMPSKQAAQEVIHDIYSIRKAVEAKGGEHLAAIILDGENAWPYFPDGGKGFLREIYKTLSSSDKVEMTTISGYLKSRPARRKIEKLWAGSWINRNFDKWIGSPQKNKAWEYLDKTRKMLSAVKDPPEAAMEEMYIAEGSDWFWWYDDFGSELNFVFDELYRMHLSNIYKILGREVPYYLTQPVPAGPAAQRLPESTALVMGSYPKVMFISPEVVPYAKTGGLADVSASLPKALSALGCDVRVIMPYYKSVHDGAFGIKKELGGVKHPMLDDGMFGFDIYMVREDGVTTYFIRNDRYFMREGLYGNPLGDYSDNWQRYSFFSRAVLAAMKALDVRPDIIHANDWQTALVPFYMRFLLSGDRFFGGIKTLFTIHNMAYQGVFDKKILKKALSPEGFFNMNDLEFYGKVNFMKSGILYSDAISTVSHRYAEEIMTPEFGCGLDGLLRAKKDTLYGIPNGADYSIWSPRNDRFIKERYDSESLEKKIECKKDLIRRARLDIDPGSPIIGSVSRFAEQKGIDLIAGIVGKTVELGAAFVILGNGSREYQRVFRSLAAKYKGKVYVTSEFNDELAHVIEAGSDIFLMPSRYEPCGLNQIYSVKYGTIPVVRATGGLDDVIIDVEEDPENGNGFKFGPATEEAFFAAVKKAVKRYADPGSWHRLMKKAMSYDYSWESSARKYLTLYRKLMG
ncbi:MAG: glycogen synthase GlgA [Candidatus Omnitrophica bacterium]|nr:glycogen synthase GlgA [Candidatus Omnitrophota bacterium]